MKATPAKFHYVFNMREISRVFKGITAIRKDTIIKTSACEEYKGKSDIFLVGLWRHECERVFVDKLVDLNDKKKVSEYIHDISIESFPSLEQDINAFFGEGKRLLFVDFLREDVKNEDGIVE